MVDASLIVDFHSHILPGVDHGSDSVETSLFQLDSAKKKGITKIISTSHFYPTSHSVKGFLDKRNAAFSALLSKGEGLPEIRLGAEVLLCNRIDKLPGLEDLCICGTRNLLLELPFSDYGNEYTNTIERLLNDGYNVILAHADRYSPDIIGRLLSFGVKLQLNADSIVGFNKIKNKYLLDWISDGKVVALGSDIHGKDSRIYSRLCKAFFVASKLSDTIAKESMKMFEEASIQYEKHKV